MLNIECPIAHQSSITFFFIHPVQNRDMSDERNAIRICLSFKDQTVANAVKKQMSDLSRKVGINLKPVFTSKKLEEHLRHKEVKPSFVNKQCVVYLLQCDLCDAGYVSYTARHLHQRIAEHESSTNVLLNMNPPQLANILKMLTGITTC